VNSSARSTLDISSAPLTMEADPSSSGATSPLKPAFGVSKNRLLPAFSSPEGLEKLATAILEPSSC